MVSKRTRYAEVKTYADYENRESWYRNLKRDTRSKVVVSHEYCPKCECDRDRYCVDDFENNRIIQVAPKVPKPRKKKPSGNMTRSGATVSLPSVLSVADALAAQLTIRRGL